MTTVQSLPPYLASDPSWLPQAIDPVERLVRLVRMDEQSYRAASFLDDRMFQQPVESLLCNWDELAGAIDPTMPTNARWIFHIGHVGSTLIARLLGELTLSIREPRILRDFCDASGNPAATDAAAITSLLSRRFAGDPPTLVKATSFVSEIAPMLCPPGERALFLFASPVNYVRSILAGENSRKELAILAGPRARRMMGRATFPDAGTSDAHLAAAAWACEMTSLEAATEAMPDRAIHWADFDLMLDDMPAALEELTRFFGYDADPATIASIASGRLMRRYSKALEYDYSPALRRELLEEASHDHRSAIEAAMDTLHRQAAHAPLLARALARASLATEF